MKRILLALFFLIFAAPAFSADYYGPDPAKVAITSGTINGATIGATTPAAITGTTFTVNTALIPGSVDAINLGSTAAEWANIYLGDGAIIYSQNDQSVTVTSSATGWAFNKAITAKIPVVDAATGLSLSAAQVSGTLITNTGQGVNDINNTLPTTAEGYHFTALVGEAQGAKYWRFTAATGATMCLDGTCGKDYVSIAAPTQGACARCYTAQFASTGIKTGAALAIGTTPTAVASGTFTFDAAGTGYAKAAVEAGTAPGNDVIPQTKYGAVAFDIGANGTVDAVEATDNATGYNSSALAIAGLPAIEAAHARMGYVTATKSDGDFTFGITNLNAEGTTVTYTSTTAYAKPYHWVCDTMVGTWATN
jgi:hypothetical protein